MVPESEIYRMLPKTKALLEADIKKRQNEVIDVSKQGADLWEGDQWHSTAYREQQLRKELAIRLLQLIDQKGGKIEVLSKPTQTDRVEIGHMVKVVLSDDTDVVNAGVPFSLIHVLTKEDVQYLGGEYNNIEEMIVSSGSPIGKVLLGLERGESATYLNNKNLQVLNDEDAISPSSLFEE